MVVDVKTQEQGRSREGKSRENTDDDDDGTSWFSLFIAAGGSRTHCFYGVRNEGATQVMGKWPLAIACGFVAVELPDLLPVPSALD